MKSTNPVAVWIVRQVNLRWQPIPEPNDLTVSGQVKSPDGRVVEKMRDKPTVSGRPKTADDRGREKMRADEPGDKRRQKRDWTAAWLMLFGIGLMVFVEFEREYQLGRSFLTRYDSLHWLNAVSEARWVPVLGYAVEHLGAVVFAAMLVRVYLEQAAQREAVSQVSNAVKEKLGPALDQFGEQVTVIRSQMNQIQTITGGNLYGKILDPKSREEIGKMLLDATFFRPEYNLELTLTSVPGQKGLVEVQMNSDYQIQNISKEVQYLSIFTSLENVLYKSEIYSNPKPSRFEKIEFGHHTDQGRKQAGLQPLRFGPSDPGRELLAEKDDELVFDYKTDMRMLRNETFFVKILATQQMRESDLFVWNMQEVTKLLKVTVHLAGGLTKDNFSVIVRPMDRKNHTGCVPADENADPSKQANPLQWTIPGPILPHQGVHIWWSPKASRSDGHPGQTEAGKKQDQPA